MQINSCPNKITPTSINNFLDDFRVRQSNNDSEEDSIEE